MEARLPIAAVVCASYMLGGSSTFAEDCGLALVLAMDASKSMTSTDFQLEFQGTASALKSTEVQTAILGHRPPVALIAFEWSGQNHQHIVRDWTMLESRQDIMDFAGSLERHQRGGIGQKTGTGSALEFAYSLLANGPDCDRKVIDVASDGYNSDGMTPWQFYATHPDAHVTVNALVIGGEARPHLWAYFDANVLRGPGAFSMATIAFEDFPKAIKEKLLRELTAPILSGTFERLRRMR